MATSIITRTYSTWHSMIQRCTNSNHKSWKYYGGRGVKVCSRWRDNFGNFLLDMGERPKDTSLDRHPNKAGNYEPGNCRWATPVEQARNRSNNHVMAIGGHARCLSEWASSVGLKKATISKRLIRGFSEEESVSPENFRNKNYTIGDETLCLTKWADRLGISVTALAGRLHRGWSIERAITTPRKHI